MNYLSFLEKDERTKLRLLRMLEASYQHRVRVKLLLDELGLTRYKLNKVVDMLASDLDEINSVHCRIFFDDNELVCNHVETSDYLELRLWYLQNSPKFQIFEYEYIDHHGQSRQRFMADHFMSQTKYYTHRAEVEKILETADRLENRSEVLSLNRELVQRVKLTNIYYHFFNGTADPFPELKTQTARFCNFLTMTYGLSLTPSERMKLRIFYQIQVKRLNEKHFINIRQLVKLSHDVRLPFLRNYYSKHIRYADHADLDSEVAYLLLFLDSQGITKFQTYTFCRLVRQQFENASQQFMTILRESQVLDQKRFKPEEQGKIANNLARLTSWMMIFDFNQSQSYKPGELQQSVQSFPALTILAKEMVKSAIHFFNLKASKPLRKLLMESYLRVLIGNIDGSLIKDSVTIYVDFVQSEVPTSYFSELIKANLGGGVKFTDHMSSDVDVYVSDIFISNIRDIPQVTWPDPLKLSSLDRLREQIVEIKEKKVEKLLKAV